jgi:flagellar biosynthesis protein FlhF
MKIKRYFAPDMRQAIRLVREEQGPEAVILSNRSVEGGVELVAAIDYDEAALARVMAAERKPLRSSACDDATPNADRPTEQTADRRIEWTQDPSIVDMRREIQELRGLLENQLAHLAYADFNRRHPYSADLIRRLDDLGLEPAHCELLISQLGDARDKDTAWELALTHLAKQIPVTNDDILSRRGVVALVGSTGVGKTTTVAKLAARYALRHGQRNVALVTTDSYRIGAHEQLVTYGRILGVPVQVASSAEELQSAVKSLMDRRLVLIDTAGMSQRDVRLSEQFATLASAGTAVQTYLVLSATNQAAVHDEVFTAFGQTALHGCVLTKADEATSLGGLISLLVEKNVPLAYVANGQRVPEDLHPARGEELVNRAVDLLERRVAGTNRETFIHKFGRIAADAHL